eukprot:364426-Chlamydomonas_euryale.AAC.46
MSVCPTAMGSVECRFAQRKGKVVWYVGCPTAMRRESGGEGNSGLTEVTTEVSSGLNTEVSSGLAELQEVGSRPAALSA